MFDYPERHNNIVRINDVFICKDCGHSRFLDLENVTIKRIFSGDEEAYHDYDKEIGMNVMVQEHD